MAVGRLSKGRLLRPYLFSALLFLTAVLLAFLQSNAVIDSSQRWVPSAMEFKMTAKTRTSKPNHLTKTLPLWLIKYAAWHDEVRKTGDWSKQPVLLVVAKDELAEGLSDRLRSIPFLLWEAYQTKRVLLIQWLRPYPLEEFLLPPPGGIDWRVPPTLILNEPSRDVVWHEYQDNFTSIAKSPYQYHRVVKTQPNPSTFLSGMDYVYVTLNHTSPDQQLSSMYKLLLTPSPPVHRLLDETMQRLGLLPKQFIGVHLRARYPDYAVQFQFLPHGWNETDTHKPKVDQIGRRIVLTDPRGLAVDMGGLVETEKVVAQLQQLISSAIRCARLNLPNANPPTPIYFASDTNLAIKLAMNATEKIVGIITTKERLHMNVDNANHKYKPSDFYPAIVDSWILSQARCLAAGQGGYSLFSAVLGGCGNCMVFYSTQNLYASRYLPHGFVTIRNITFCKPLKDKMVRKLRHVIELRTLETSRMPQEKRFLSHATWNFGN